MTVEEILETRLQKERKNRRSCLSCISLPGWTVPCPETGKGWLP